MPEITRRTGVGADGHGLCDRALYEVAGRGWDLVVVRKTLTVAVELNVECVERNNA